MSTSGRENPVEKDERLPEQRTEQGDRDAGLGIRFHEGMGHGRNRLYYPC